MFTLYERPAARSGPAFSVGPSSLIPWLVLLALMWWPLAGAAQNADPVDAEATVIPAEPSSELSNELSNEPSDEPVEEPSTAGTETLKEPEPPQYQSRRERDQQLLAERFPDEAQWLALPEGDTLALYRPAMAAPKGTLLMLHSAERPPHWLPELANLRRALPRHGWATLAVAMPLPAPPPIPPRPEPPEPDVAPETAPDAAPEAPPEMAATPPAPSPVNQAPLPPRAERIAHRVNATLDWLALRGEDNLVVLVDSRSAPDVLAILQPQLANAADNNAPINGESPLAGPIRALIIVNGAAPDQALSNHQLMQLFERPELPVLDVFTGHSTFTRELQRRHRDMARRQQLLRYQPFVIGPPDVHDPEREDSVWVRRVQGFMQRQLRRTRATASAT